MEITWHAPDIQGKSGNSIRKRNQTSILTILQRAITPQPCTVIGPSLQTITPRDGRNSLSHHWIFLATCAWKVGSTSYTHLSYAPWLVSTAPLPITLYSPLSYYSLKEFLQKIFTDANPEQLAPPAASTVISTHTPQDSHLTHLRATLLHGIIHAFSQGKVQGLVAILGDLIGSLFTMQTDPDVEVSREARQACALAAQVYHWPSSLPPLLSFLSSVSSSNSWRVRSAFLPFLQYAP